MKRNVIVILTLALVCVLFVACGKEEITQQQYNAAMSKVEEAEAALNAAKAELQNLNQNSDAVTTPVEKTRDQMTEKEKEVYDKAKIEEFTKSLEGLSKEELEKALDDAFINGSNRITNMGFYRDDDGKIIPFYVPGLENVPEDVYDIASTPLYAGTIAIAAIDGIDSSFIEELEDVFVQRPDLMVQAAILYHEIEYGSMHNEDLENFLKSIV